MESLGDRIANLRKELDINQKELATKVGITEASLSRYENNLREPKSEIIVRLAKALETSTDYLLGVNDNTKISKEDKLIIENLSVSEKTKKLLEKIYSLEKEDREAIEKMTTEKDITIALLDVMLPDISGIEVCKFIRENFDQVGIIMLTAKAQEDDKIEGFISGADDYIIKPFSIKELLVRVSALLRRVAKDDSSVKSSEIVSPPFILDIDKRKLFKNGKEIELTPTEFSIVKYLISNAKQSLSRDQILDEVWGTNYLYDFKIVDVNIRRIRNKIEDDPSKPKYIQTIWGYGYCFRKEE
ncbi:TPA: winged helix-turn-helix domain-containing protein [Clostridioides difficile]|nr:winged helix-turn-helix domain-containing protein [Clostridioides difficile]